MSRVVADEPNREMRCGFVSRLGQNVKAERCCSLPPPSRMGWRRSGAAAAAQLAFVVAAASLLDEWSSNDHPGDPHERNRDKEREGHACAPAPGNRHRDPAREHRGDDHSTPRHDPRKCVLRRCASPVESQMLKASVGSDYRRDSACGSSTRDSRPRLRGVSRNAGKATGRHRLLGRGGWRPRCPSAWRRRSRRIARPLSHRWRSAPCNEFY